MVRRATTLAALGLLLGSLTGCSAGGSTGGAGSAPSPQHAAAAVAGFGDVPRIVRQAEPSVVTVTTSKGLGSGVIWSAGGEIVTDAHVVGDATHVTVQFADGKQAPGDVLARDEFTDLGVLRVPRKGLPAATFADALPPVGSLAVVIGTPLGLMNTVTAGIISAHDRDLPPSAETPHGLFGLVQTDAPISPGNSGGAVLDGRGRVVGISEAYVPPSQGAVAIGFATPATVVAQVVPQLLASGHAQHAYLGVKTGQLTPQIAQQLGVEQTSGVIVLQVVGGSPAERAGLEPGDLIVRIGSDDVAGQEDLLAALRRLAPKQTTTIGYVRDGKRRQAQVTLADYP